jgi:hypothetical protein
LNNIDVSEKSEGAVGAFYSLIGDGLDVGALNFFVVGREQAYSSPFTIPFQCLEAALSDYTISHCGL